MRALSIRESGRWAKAPDRPLSAHWVVGYFHIAAMVMHVSGALKHHLIDKVGSTLRLVLGAVVQPASARLQRIEKSSWWNLCAPAHLASRNRYAMRRQNLRDRCDRDPPVVTRSPSRSIRYKLVPTWAPAHRFISSGLSLAALSARFCRSPDANGLP